MVTLRIGSNPIEFGDLESKVKVTVTSYPFFLHHSLLASLLYISVLLRLILLKFGMSLRYTLGRPVFKFHKNRMVDDVIVTSFKAAFHPCVNVYI